MKSTDEQKEQIISEILRGIRENLESRPIEHVKLTREALQKVGIL